ncbi:MAG: deoxynucleoside kinase [Gammaproteobacteria bacterium]
MTEAGLRHIVVEGPIGVGKTTLARRLAQSFDSDLILEIPEENPFLPQFYRDPRRHALPTQLSFLFQRAQQMQALRQRDLFQPVIVADFIIDKDPLFARLNLTSDELNLYNLVYQQLAIDAPAPDLVIYLQAPVEVLKERISRRRNDYERSISAEYLQRLIDAYVEFFYHYTQSPLLIVNVADVDLAGGQVEYDELLRIVRGGPVGRQYVNLRQKMSTAGPSVEQYRRRQLQMNSNPHDAEPAR